MSPPWPYPRWIAHRGAGKLAPENTLAAFRLGCVAIVCNHALWDTALVAQVKGLGMRTLSYTVNDDWAAQRLIALGTDGIITDRVDFFSPATA